MTASISTGLARPLIARLYTNAGVFKQSLGQLIEQPPLKHTLNSTGTPIQISLQAPITGATAPVQGDLVKISEQGGDGSLIGTFLVEDLPDDYDATVLHGLTLNPIGVELGEADFTQSYLSATDISVMVQAAVNQTQHLTWDATSIPSAGVTAIYSFNHVAALDVLTTAQKIGGPNFYWFIDENGKVWFGQANLSTATYRFKFGADYGMRKYRSPIGNLKNKIVGYGAILANQAAPITATYDQSGGSQYGIRALIPPVQYPDCTDQTTLQNIVNTIGAALNRRQTTVQLELPAYGTRISLASATGVTAKYWEPAVQSFDETDTGTGAFSPVYVIQEVEWDGPTQRVVMRDLAITVDDLKYEIEAMLKRQAQNPIQNLLPITPGQIVNATAGGPNSPSTVAGLALTTGVDNEAQTNNSWIQATWTANPAGDNVVRYDIQFKKSADTTWTSKSAIGSPWKLGGLYQGVSYDFQVRAVNNLGQVSAWSSTVTITSGADVTAPAVPTGLAAIKTPRGALVSWNGNTESDLQGYRLKVSVGGAGYTIVFDKQLATSFAYVAPSGTALGTSLTFEVAAVDWSGNYSADSSPSTAVNTDGIVFDELLVGNLKVFGTVTTGGFQTAALVDPTHAGWKIDLTSIRAYDGSGTNYGAPSGAGVTVEITSAGNAFFSGTVAASQIYGSVIATSAAVAQGLTGAGAGFRLGASGATPFLDFFTVGTVTAGTRFYYAPNNNTGFSLVGVLAAGTMTFAKGGPDSATEQITTTGGPLVADVLVIASFKNATTIALKGSLGAFTITNGGSITPPFGQATTAGNLLIAWVACNAATPPSITTSASGWTKAIAANGTNVEADIWYKANCGASETAPTFTATLVSPSAADSLTETITTSGTLLANSNCMVMATFTPASQSTPIALVSAGAVATGSATTVSPAFGQATASGHLLVAHVSGQVGTSGGGQANLGATAAATYGDNWSDGLNNYNLVFMGPYSMPQHGTITSLSVYVSSDSSVNNHYLCIWDSNGNLVGQSNGFNPAVGTRTFGGQALQTQNLQSNLDAPSGNSYYIGFYRSTSTGGSIWGVKNGGSFKAKSSSSSTPPSASGYTNCSSTGFFCGDMQAYATYTIVSPGTDITTTASGWTKAIQALDSLEECQIWYKANCGVSEAAPTFTSANGTEVLFAQLSEWSGVATSSPLDKTGSFLQTTASSSMTVAASAVDAQNGDLVVTASRWAMSGAATATFGETLNNAAPVDLGNTGGTSQAQQANFSYGIVPVPSMHAQLAEFSGAATSSPLEFTGSVQTGSTNPITAVANGTDTGTADLIVTAGRWQQTGNTTASWQDSYNNATPVDAGNSGASALSQHSNFAYGIVSGSTTGEVLQLTNFTGLEAVTGSGALGRGLISTQYSGDANGAMFIARKARGTISSPAAIANGDTVGGFFAQAYDGTNWLQVGQLTVQVNGAVSAGTIPTAFVLDRALNIPPNAGGTVATTQYGSVPIKLTEFAGTNTPSVTFSSIPTGFRDLRIRARLGTVDAISNRPLYLRLNGDGTPHYHWVGALFNAAYNNSIGTGQTQMHVSYIPGTTGANGRDQCIIQIVDYNDSANDKTIDARGGVANVYGSATGNLNQLLHHGWWASHNAVTSTTLLPDANNISGVIVLEADP